MMNYAGFMSCMKCARTLQWGETCYCSVYAKPDPIVFIKKETPIMQKIKLSETEKEQLKIIRDQIHSQLKNMEVENAYSIGWLFGLIDRITE